MFTAAFPEEPRPISARESAGGSSHDMSVEVQYSSGGGSLFEERAGAFELELAIAPIRGASGSGAGLASSFESVLRMFVVKVDGNGDSIGEEVT